MKLYMPMMCLWTTFEFDGRNDEDGSIGGHYTSGWKKKKKEKIIIYICFCYLFQKLMIYYYTCKKHFKELLNEGGDSENQIVYFVIMI